ncbi:MAG: ABC transporter ATP-binding protein [Gemmatimonadota bacterium]
MNRPGVRRRLFSLLRPQRGLFTAGLCAALVGSILDGATAALLIPILKLQFHQGPGFGEGNSRLERWLSALLGPLVEGVPPAVATLRLVLVFLAALSIKIVASYLAGYISVLVQEGVVKELRLRLWRHLLRLDLGVFQRTRGGQLATALVSDADQVKLVVVAVLAAFFQNLVSILTMLVVMLALSWRLTVGVLLLAPILVIGVRLLQTRLRRHSRAFTHERGELTATITERLGAMKLIRAFGAEALESAAFDRQAERYRKGYVRTQRFALLTSPVSELFGGAVIMLILWAAANQGLSGVVLDGPEAIAFLVTAARLLSPIKAITQVPSQLAIAEASAERIFAVLDIPDAELDAPDAPAAVFEHDLVVDDVTFGYDPLLPVLRGVSFRVAKGEVVALVGPSGGGKTTLLELVPRFYDPQGGALRLDGVALTSLSRRSLRDLIAVVSQDTVLLHDTVRANIAYGRPDASDVDVEVAARAANAHAFIDSLPDGYNTVLGERGTRLSGGQRQRIAIARALLRDAPILILDEATSALDTESERLVQEAIDRLMQDRTVLVIAHRLATVREADRILVLEAGRIIESGTHDALHAHGGLYRRLHDLQFSAAEVTT